jgi:hypothetical protein
MVLACHWDQASTRRLAFEVITFSAFTDAISRLSMMSLVLAISTWFVTRSGMATISQKAVVFIATEMLADKRSAFSAGFALATAVNASMSPMIVPRSPRRVAMFEARAT